VAATIGQPVGEVRQEDFAGAFAQMQNLLVEAPEVTDFLTEIAQLASAVVGAQGCGITLRRDNREVATVASSNELANYVDEIQYGRGQGPCLQAMNTSTAVTVIDLATEERWPRYTPGALAAGVRASLSLPLVIDGAPFGALNLYLTSAGTFSAAHINNAWAFARQAVTTLTLARRQADHLSLDSQLHEATASRAIIDQALGIIMGQRRIDSADAFGVLRELSQNTNRKLRVVAIATIEAATGRLVRGLVPYAVGRETFGPAVKS
jgi:GAF domain-containing protein